MIPGFRKTSFTETPEEHARNVEIKKRLIHELSITVKELQKSHLDDDMEIDKNDEHALMLCTLLEAAFLHGYQDTGLKMSNFYHLLGRISPAESMPSYSFWNLLVQFTHKDIRQELEHLSHVNTLIGQCRAWVRLALNDCLIESYLDAMLSDVDKLRKFYKPSAFILEEEMPYIMISFLQGLVEFKFNLNYNTPSLNNWTGDTLAYAGIWQLPKYAAHSSHPAPVPVPQPRSPSTSFASTTAQSQRPVEIARRSRDEPTEVEVARSVKETDTVDLVVNGTAARRHEVLGVSQPPGLETEITVHTDIEEEKPVELNESSLLVDGSQEENKITPEIPARPTAISPVPMLGSNKLGVTSGWSSTFNPGMTSTDNKEPKRNKTHGSPPLLSKEALQNYLVADPETYTHLLSDYTVQGHAQFDHSLFNNEEDGKKEINIQRDQSPDMEPQMPGFEVVPQSSSVHSEHTDDRTHYLMSILTKITNEKGLDNQNYQCTGCGRNIGMIYGEAKVCKYDSCYYCYECHTDEEHVIPARIIYNWDLRKHSVSKHTKLFLLQIEEEPLLNIDETNPSLYSVVHELKEVKMLRTQLLHLKGFLLTCKEPIAEEVRRRIWPREYLWDDIHQYSMLDLIQTNSGQLSHHLNKVISYSKKHVYKCQLCCQKGFICEVCNDSKIIYPFQIKFTTQCPKCKAVFHKVCIADRKCPRCSRRHKQLAGKVLESNTLEFNSPWE